jgi:hypothetical protein
LVSSQQGSDFLEQGDYEDGCPFVIDVAPVLSCFAYGGDSFGT